MRKVTVLFSFFSILYIVLSASVLVKEQVNWISIEEAEVLYKKSPKPIIIDLYTDWCGWCKEMDRKTYQNKQVVGYINAHFYAVKFDAESEKEITFNNKRYTFNEKHKTHELAEYLMQHQLQYPTTVFLSSINAEPAPLPGYLKASELEAPLKYFAEHQATGKTFIEFNRNFKGEW